MTLRYEGPVYRPPSEADSLLIQATIGCPHNKCSFCMVYKKGPHFRIRPVSEIKEDLERAKLTYGDVFRSLFFPAGNTIAMPTEALAEVCEHARVLFPRLERITVYGSSKYVRRKDPRQMKRLKESGLSRIHVGLESGDDVVLKRIKKGSDAAGHVRAGQKVMDAGIELSEYVMLGIGGQDRTGEHAEATARVLSDIDPDFIRLRTFLPKANTLLLHQIRKAQFRMLGPHDVLRETRRILENLHVHSQVTSDHYTNYLDIRGRLPRDRNLMLERIDSALSRDEGTFRPVYVGTQ